MIDRIRRSRPQQSSGTTERVDPRARDRLGPDGFPVDESGSKKHEAGGVDGGAAVGPVNRTPRVDPRSERQSRLRPEMRVQPPAPEEKGPSRRNPRAEKQSRLRTDVDRGNPAETAVAKPPETASAAAPDIIRVANPAFHVLAVTLADEAFAGAERELAGAARSLADAGGGAVVLMRFAANGEGAAEAGADRLILAGGGPATEQARAEAIAAAADMLVARHILFAESLADGDVARRLAVLLGERPVFNIVRFSPEGIMSRIDGGRLEAVRPSARIFVVGAGVADTYAGGRREAQSIEFAAGTHFDPRIRDLGLEPLSVMDVPLADADFILSAGDGISDWPSFFALAETLSGVVGGSRQVCDAGLLPRHRQVGASGTLVEAKCYFALGISGAPQHLQGVQRCRHVVAVNTDLHAAMVKRADLAIIADAQAVMPALIRLAKERADG